MIAWTFFNKYLFSPKAGSLIKRISWLCVIGIGLSLTTFVLVLSIMTGLNKSIHRRILSVEPHITAEFKNLADEQTIQSHEAWAFLNSQKDLNVRLFDTQVVILRTIDGLFHGATIRGMSEESFTSMLTQLRELADQTHSVAPDYVDAPLEDEVIVGVDLAKALGIFEGDFLTVLPLESLTMAPGESPIYSRVRVKQILSTNIAENDSEYVYYQRFKSMNTLQKVGSRRVGFEIWTKDPYQLEDLKSNLSQFTDLKVETWKDRNSALFFALKLEKLMIGTFLGLSALITSFSIFSVLSILISQKRREIGLLMAIGFSLKKISKLFQSLGLMLSGFGILSGVILGSVGAIYLQTHPLRIVPDIYYDTELPAHFELSFVILVTLVAFALAWMAVKLSIAQLSKLTPSEALRIN